MSRHVEREILDVLPPGDPRARRSRRELRRVNGWMGNARWLAGGLSARWDRRKRRVVTDLGTGDGWVTLATLNRVMARESVDAENRLWLVDQQPVVTADTLAKFRDRGWRPTVVAEDAESALVRREATGSDVVLANLFLHHFDDAALRRLLAVAAGACPLLAACEPRRSAMGRWGARLLWGIGCGGVTRHDARVSVEAGFRDREISALWPADGGWHLEERRAGPFSHLFVAWREEQEAR